MEVIANNEILAFLWLYRQIVWVVLSTMALLVMIIVWWNKVKYFFMNVGYSLPLLGKIVRSGNDKTPSYNKENSWYDCETAICSDFYNYYLDSDNKDAEFYDKSQDYLSKCQEIGRSKKGVFLSALLIFLILFEAVGFAYVLAPFMVQNVSANDASMLAWFTAFLLSIAAVFLTDKMGEEIHFNSLIRKIRAWHGNEDAHKNLFDGRKTITISKTYEDDGEEAYEQLLNRINANHDATPKHTMTMITIVYIVIIAMGAFFVRSYTLDSIETESVNSTSSPFVSSSSSAVVSSPFDLPAESQSLNQIADEKAGDEQKDALHMASITTFAILSVIFVAIQVLGVMFGYLYSLSGRESSKAWKYTKGFNNVEEFVAYHQRKRTKIAGDAQSKLSSLQQRLANRHITSGAEKEARNNALGHKNFEQYIDEQEEVLADREAKDSERKRKKTERELKEKLVTKTKHIDLEPVLNQQGSQKIDVKEEIPVKQPSVLESIGDISDFDDQDIIMLADELGVDVDMLHRKKRIQLKINAAKITT